MTSLFTIIGVLGVAAWVYAAQLILDTSVYIAIGFMGIGFVLAFITMGVGHGLLDKEKNN